MSSIKGPKGVQHQIKANVVKESRAVIDPSLGVFCHESPRGVELEGKMVREFP